MNIMKLITDSRLAFVGVIFGPIVGLFYKDLAQNCQYANDIYLMLMQLAVIPFMITTIVMGVLELIYNADAKKGVYNIISKSSETFS
ncbi:MAG: cation:dicarboxylase symporter family transporter [Pseudomonadota bacterium]